MWNFERRSTILLWQICFILLCTTWLWAPSLNHLLDARTSLISQYEVQFEPYSWMFRLGDALGAVALLIVAKYLLSRPGQKLAGWLLFAVGAGMLIDPAVPTTCHFINNACQEYFSPFFLVHSIESVFTASAILTLGAYDFWRRRGLVSAAFLFFQIGYLGLFLSQLATRNSFNTISQFLYQTVVVVWLAWFCQSIITAGRIEKPTKAESKLVRYAASVWAFANGLLAILISLAHLHLLGKLKGLYFAGDSAWLAQHGVIIGVLMLYISRHLARGELRARQAFLVILGIETLKYSVITPNAALMMVYLLSFCVLFALRDNFDVGNLPTSVKIRLKEVLFMLGALALSLVASLAVLLRNSHLAKITHRAANNYIDYVARTNMVSHHHLKSALLAHTFSAFLLAGSGVIVWILFRPSSVKKGDSANISLAGSLLSSYSASTEDYFKLWPEDKDYFWSQQKNGFIAYKIVGPIAFALADPIAPPGQHSRLAEEFVAWSRSRRLRACFLPVYPPSSSLYKKIGLSSLQIGASASVDITGFMSTTANNKWWRWQKNRGTKAGYQYKISHPPHDLRLMGQLKEVSDSWLGKPGRQERSFALGYFDKEYIQKCTVHYLTDQKGRVLAFTNQMPSFRPSRTATIDLLRYLPGDSGPMPFLLYNIILHLGGTLNYKYFDLGFVPFAASQKSVIKLVKVLSAGRFSASGLEQFKNKFKPQWQPNYLVYDGDLGDLALIAANVEKLMTPSSFVKEK